MYTSFYAWLVCISAWLGVLDTHELCSLCVHGSRVLQLGDTRAGCTQL